MERVYRCSSPLSIITFFRHHHLQQRIRRLLLKILEQLQAERGGENTSSSLSSRWHSTVRLEQPSRSQDTGRVIYSKWPGNECKRNAFDGTLRIHRYTRRCLPESRGRGWKSPPFVPPFHRLSAVGAAVRNEWMHRRVRGRPERKTSERDSSFRSRIIVVGSNPAAVVYISYREKERREKREKEERIFPGVISIHGFRFLAYRRFDVQSIREKLTLTR